MNSPVQLVGLFILKGSGLILHKDQLLAGGNKLTSLCDCDCLFFLLLLLYHLGAAGSARCNSARHRSTEWLRRLCFHSEGRLGMEKKKGRKFWDNRCFIIQCLGGVIMHMDASAGFNQSRLGVKCWLVRQPNRRKYNRILTGWYRAQMSELCIVHMCSHSVSGKTVLLHLYGVRSCFHRSSVFYCEKIDRYCEAFSNVMFSFISA